MSRQWTIEENTICFYVLKDFIQCPKEKKDDFVIKIRNQYPLLSARTKDALKQHLKYLYLLSIDEQENYSNRDEHFKGILLENNLYENSENSGVIELLVINQKEKLELNGKFELEELVESQACLSDEQIHSLNSFIGYGEFNKTTIAFFGNEGGLGELSVQENINLLTNEYKKNKENYFDGEHWQNGYWYIEEYSSEKVSSVPNSPFLYLTTRIMLALEDKESSIDDWFKKGDIAKLENVRKFISNGGLYSNKVGLKSALFDWRPLPRRNERDNQFPYKNINVKEYLQAFQFKGQSDNQYNDWVLKRIDLFKNILSKFKIPILLSFGDVQSKLILFQNIWPEIKFKRLVLEASNKTIYVSKEKVGSNTTVIVAEFLDYQNLGYTGTKELVKYLKEHIIES